MSSDLTYPLLSICGVAVAAVLFLYLVVQTIRHEYGQLSHFKNPPPDRESRAKALAAIAPGIGMIFLNERNHSHPTEFPQFSIFRKGYFQYRYHTLLDACEFGVQPRHFMAGDFSYKQDIQVMLDLKPKTYDFSYMIVLHGYSLEGFLWIRRRDSQSIFKHSKNARTFNLGCESFQTMFTVYASDETTARRILKPQFRDFLFQIHDRLGSLEIALSGDAICISDGESLWEPDRFGTIAHWANTLADLVQPVLHSAP